MDEQRGELATVVYWAHSYAGIGPEALSVVSMTIVAKSFAARQLGLAMAWYAIISAPFHLLLIKGIGWALNDAHFGWREVWGGVGFSLIALSAASFFLARNPPRPSPAARPRRTTHRQGVLSAKPWRRRHSGSSD